jgi:hypothetical protein
MSSKHSLFSGSKTKTTRIRWSSLVAFLDATFSRSATKQPKETISFYSTKNNFVNRMLRSSLFEGRGGGGGHGNPDWVKRHFQNAIRWMNIQNNFKKNSILI